MNPKDLQVLKADIESGLVMIVLKEHYYRLTDLLSCHRICAKCGKQLNEREYRNHSQGSCSSIRAGRGARKRALAQVVGSSPTDCLANFTMAMDEHLQEAQP